MPIAARPPVRVLLLLASVAGLMAGCESSGEGPAAAVGPTAARDTLAVALPDAPAELDPLLAATRTDELIVRQVYEPLVESLAGPYGDVRSVPGLLLSTRPFAGDTEWRLHLRSGVRFQDGSLFNAGAVLANAQRWETTDAGRALLPGLVAVDAPRPDLARLFFDRPVADVPRLLASPRLGIVSPRALVPRSGEGAAMRRSANAGTGPFEIRERDRNEVLVARNVDWWGTGHQLGPALDQVDFQVVPNADQRLAMLRGGTIQVADRLGPDQEQRLRNDPLLMELAGPDGTALGLERSVRGIESATEIPSFSTVWLTRIGAG